MLENVTKKLYPAKKVILILIIYNEQSSKFFLRKRLFLSMIDHWVNEKLNKKIIYISEYVPKNISANTITLVGFIIGLFAVSFISIKYYILGLVLIIINRFCDGLDGVIARRNGTTSLGGYLDITCDFIFYSAVIFGFALADQKHNSLAAIFLLFSFVGTGTSFLAFAAIEKKHNLFLSERGQKAFYYDRGIVEGTETIAFFVIICLLPEYFPIFGIIFGFLCWLTVCGRIFSAYFYLR